MGVGLNFIDCAVQVTLDVLDILGLAAVDIARDIEVEAVFSISSKPTMRE